jgi:23S rRNA (uridine2552-2'-O)-methyltransferase
VVFLQRDILEPTLEEELAEGYTPFDVVLSDAAPSTTGIRVADSARSALLFECAFHLAQRTLKPQGHFLAKIFQGSEFHSLLQEVKKRFGWVKVIKPSATRKNSKEIYILAMRFKNPLSKPVNGGE